MSIYFSGSNTPTSGAAGQGVPTGGANGQVLKKNSSTDYDTSWAVLSSSYISDFATTVLATVLTGLSLATSTPVVSTDTALVAIGKLQAQVTLRIGLYFTESRNTSTPNATIPAHKIISSGSETDIDMVLSPKANGAFILGEVPDNSTTVGGNKRGTNAVDLQLGPRTAANQVGSGANTFTAGRFNVVSGAQSVSIGSGNVSSGISAVSLGLSCTSSSTAAFSVGNACTASGANSYATGTQSNTSSVTGRQSHACGAFNLVGDAQSSRFRLRIATTDATPTVMTADGAAATSLTRVALQNNNAFAFSGMVIGKKTGTTNVASWKFEGQITRGANAAATTLDVSTITVISNAPAWGTPTLTADTTNGALILTVTGLAATSIRWSAHIDTCEIIYT